MSNQTAKMRFIDRRTYSAGPQKVIWPWRYLVGGASLDEVLALRRMLARSVLRRRLGARRTPPVSWGTRAVRAPVYSLTWDWDNCRWIERFESERGDFRSWKDITSGN
jgi:hypothetical protein